MKTGQYAPEMSACPMCGVWVLPDRPHPVEFCRKAIAAQVAAGQISPTSPDTAGK